jgi:hypothetical protein
MASKKSVRRLDPDDLVGRVAAAARRYAGRPARPSPELPADVQAVVLDRLEAAYVAGLIDPDRFAEVLAPVVPEECPERPAGRPASTSAAGSPARVAEYAARAAAGEPVVRASDTDAFRADRRAVEIRLRENGHGHRVVGWAKNGKPRPVGLPAGMYRDARGAWFELD